MSNARYLQFANGEVHDNSHLIDHPGATPITKAQYLAIYRQRRVDDLRRLFKPGDDVATVLAHVSKSGMRRSIKVLAVDGSGRIDNISWIVAVVIGRQYDRKNGGVICNGCGMDMGFDLVYSMSRALFSEGLATEDGCSLEHYWI